MRISDWHLGHSMLVHVGHCDPLACAGPPTAGHQRMHVRVPGAEVAGGLHHRDHAGPQGLIAGGRGHQLAGRLPCRPGEPSKQLPVVQEEASRD